MDKTIKKVVAITVLLVVAVAFVPTAIAPPPTITVKGTVTDENGVLLLGDGSETSDLVHLINADDNSIICEIRIGEGYLIPPDWNQGKFMADAGVEVGTNIYCRAWNDPSYEQATYSGDSGPLLVTGAGIYNFTWQTLTSPAQPPVPDLPAIILFGAGLLVITGYFCLRSKRK